MPDDLAELASRVLTAIIFSEGQSAKIRTGDLANSFLQVS